MIPMTPARSMVVLKLGAGRRLGRGRPRQRRVPRFHAGDLGEAFHEMPAAELAVADDRQAVGFLLGDQHGDRGVLERTQLGRIAGTGGKGRRRLLEGRRAQEAADDVDPQPVERRGSRDGHACPHRR